MRVRGVFSLDASASQDYTQRKALLVSGKPPRRPACGAAVSLHVHVHKTTGGRGGGASGGGGSRRLVSGAVALVGEERGWIPPLQVGQSGQVLVQHSDAP